MNGVLVFWVYLASVPILGLAIAILSLRNCFSLQPSPIFFPICWVKDFEPGVEAVIPALLKVGGSKFGRFTYLGIVSVFWPLKVLWVLAAWVSIAVVSVVLLIKFLLDKLDGWITD